MMMLVSSKIVVCPSCEGKGYTLERSGAYDDTVVPCSYCQGYRVVLEQITHNTVSGAPIMLKKENSAPKPTVIPLTKIEF